MLQFGSFVPDEGGEKKNSQLLHVSSGPVHIHNEF